MKNVNEKLLLYIYQKIKHLLLLKFIFSIFFVIYSLNIKNFFNFTIKLSLLYNFAVLKFNTGIIYEYLNKLLFTNISHTFTKQFNTFYRAKVIVINLTNITESI